MGRVSFVWYVIQRLQKLEIVRRNMVCASLQARWVHIHEDSASLQFDHANCLGDSAMV
jgi:hypothetical protein